MQGKEEGAKKTKRPLLLVSIAVRVLIFVALISGTALALRPLQTGLIQRMEAGRDNFFSQAEQYLGHRIQYGSIGPSIFGSLDVRDVRVLREDDSVLLSISRLRLSYSFWRLLRGNVLDSFHAARIHRLILDLDSEKDADIIQRFALATDGLNGVQGRRNGVFANGALANAGAYDGLENDVSGFLQLFPENFSLAISSGQLGISTPVGDFVVKGLDFDAQTQAAQLGFQGSWNVTTALNGDFGFETEMSMRVSGVYFSCVDEGSATVAIPSFFGDNFSFNPLAFNFSFANGKLQAQNVPGSLHHSNPAVITLVYDVTEGSFSGDFTSENFPLSDLLSFSGDWAGFNNALDLLVSGNAHFAFLSDGSPVYSLDFQASFPGNSPIYLNFQALGHSNYIEIQTLQASSADGSLCFQGGVDLYNLAPHGNLELVNFGTSGTGGISGNFAISSEDRSVIRLSGENLSARNAAISLLDAVMYREEDGFAFTVFVGSERGGTMRIDGSSDANPSQFRTVISLYDFPASDVLEFSEPFFRIPVVPFVSFSAAQNVYLTADVFFAAYDEHFIYNVPDFLITQRGRDYDTKAHLSFSGSERRFDLSLGEVNWCYGSLTFLASADFSNPDDISFAMSTTHSDLTYFFQGTIENRRSVNVVGSYDFNIALNADDAGVFRGYVSGEHIPFPSGNRIAFLSFLFDATIASASSWQVGIQQFDITNLVTPGSPFSALSLTGVANERGIEIPEITFDDGRGVLEGTLFANWENTSFIRFRADMHGYNSYESYVLTGSVYDRLLELDFLGTQMQLLRVSPHNAVASGSLNLAWESVESFTLEADLASLTLRRGIETVNAQASARADQDTFMLHDINVFHAGLGASIPYFTVSRETSSVQAQGVIQGSIHRRPLDLSFSIASNFNSTQSWLDVIRNIQYAEGFLDFDTARYHNIVAEEPFRFAFSAHRRETGFSVSVSGGPQNMLRVRHDSGDGAFFAALSYPSPVRGSITGMINSNYIDVSTPNLFVDMASLWRFIPPDTPVEFPVGIVTANVRIAGPIGDPGFYGVARGTGVHVIVPDFIPQPIRPAPVTFILEGNEMTFGPVGTAVGRGGGVASAWFLFDRWVPNVLSIDINVPWDTPIPYGFNIEGFIAEGLASGRLTLALEDQLFSVSGDLTAHNTEISFDGREMDSGFEPFDEGENFIDLTIRMGRRVEFFWPSVSFPFLQATADMGSSIHVISDSASGRFSLQGDVGLRTGELFYLERNFHLREGMLFFDENEHEFDPRISARAEIRDVADVGPVTISMIIDYAPLLSFIPRFESTPPLSPIEIFSLLGQTTRDGEAPANLAATAALDTFAQFVINRRIQQWARDVFGLDMFSVRTQFFQNMVMQAAGAQPLGGGTRDGQYRLGNFFDNTTVFMGRYFGGAFFAQAMLSIRYDEDRLSTGGLLLEPELGFEMRNPLFDIRFSMIPLHPENWFIDDISLSLLWRRTF
ncbi:MAG: translocation/assembly module TamB [Treponema sp.]|nr:translocation/assembly module TamB [Treponema sp.]